MPSDRVVVEPDSPQFSPPSSLQIDSLFARHRQVKDLGTISGSGPLGGPITITLKRHATSDPQHFTFSFELTDHSDSNIITHAISGVVVESYGN